MRRTRLAVSVFLGLCLWAAQAFADGALVIGENLKVGMPLKDALVLLGHPESLRIYRGTETAADSVAVEYPNHGVIVRALNMGTTVEGIDILPGFKGRFASGVKIGDKFSVLIEKYGTPQSLSMDIARYPNLGLYFLLKDQLLVSGKSFAKGSKLLDSRLANPTEN